MIIRNQDEENINEMAKIFDIDLGDVKDKREGLLNALIKKADEERSELGKWVTENAARILELKKLESRWRMKN